MPAAINVTYHSGPGAFNVDITPANDQENIMYQVMIGTEVTTNSKTSFIQKVSIDSTTSSLNVSVTAINSCGQLSSTLKKAIPNPMTSESCLR